MERGNGTGKAFHVMIQGEKVKKLSETAFFSCNFYDFLRHL